MTFTRHNQNNTPPRHILMQRRRNQIGAHPVRLPQEEGKLFHHPKGETCNSK